MQATRKEGGFPVHLHTSPYGQDVRGEQMARSSSAPNRSVSELSSPLVQSIKAKVMAQWSLESVQALCEVRRACMCVCVFWSQLSMQDAYEIPLKEAVWCSDQRVDVVQKPWRFPVLSGVRAPCFHVQVPRKWKRKKPWCTTAHSHPRSQRFIKLLLSTKICNCGPRRQKYGRRWRPAHVCGSSAYLRDKSLQGDENREWKIEERGGRVSST